MNAAGSSENSAAVNGGGQADTATNKSGAAASSLTPGELLRRERERRSISQLQAAEDLHLDTRVVEAIEANRFDLLGAPVYARGHLKKYATLVGLSPEFIIQRYEALTDRPEVPMPVPASVTSGAVVDLEQRGTFKGPLLVSVTLIVLALGWWIFDEVTRSSSAPIEQVPSLEPAQDAPPVTVAVEVPATTAPPPVVSAPAVQPKPVVVADPVRVKLEYSDASWTEIYDAEGKQLMFSLGEIGRVRTVSGTPPLRVTLGNASAVTVQVNERPVVVPRRAGRDSAKFSIRADGQVQPMSDEVPVE
jgi:cytoskeleton protein RodZ